MRNAALKAKTRRGLRPCQNTGNRASGVAENLLLVEFSFSGAVEAGLGQGRGGQMLKRRRSIRP